MKKIIVPVDFSKHSEYALETAAALAKQHNSELIVMHMLEMSESIFSASSAERGEENAFMLMVANKKFEAFLDQPYLEGLEVTPMVKYHKVLKEVAEVAADVRADLIVMGSRGHSDHDGVFTGSNTEKVVRYSNTPVLVIKSKPKSVNFEHIVLATDFSEESVPAVKKAHELLIELGQKTTLLHINSPNLTFLSTDEIDEKIATFLKLAKLNESDVTIARISDHNVEDGVSNFARKQQADAIAMITHGRKGLSHFFGGSISEDVVNHSKLPVITFKL
ncbi:nucleotide-binding universal stress UspA family protein [Winogradskyella pacifica]|uniref:Nucleotide-binding universal stress UspA family protein n=1 Tax=Winogradskyella pacifica TaxID=664642 RepID=A0A3D9LLE3_9FLAO|nr:universal stress protein [Winogradskyella pacifica]REE08211.1 nucleotide-binding universal stress UspA family protein [Winogradskyella pacifica]